MIVEELWRDRKVEIFEELMKSNPRHVLSVADATGLPSSVVEESLASLAEFGFVEAVNPERSIYRVTPTVRDAVEGN